MAAITMECSTSAEKVSFLLRHLAVCSVRISLLPVEDNTSQGTTTEIRGKLPSNTNQDGARHFQTQRTRTCWVNGTSPPAESGAG